MKVLDCYIHKFICKIVWNKTSIKNIFMLYRKCIDISFIIINSITYNLIILIDLEKWMRSFLCSSKGLLIKSKNIFEKMNICVLWKLGVKHR